MQKKELDPQEELIGTVIDVLVLVLVLVLIKKQQIFLYFYHVKVEGTCTQYY